LIESLRRNFLPELISNNKKDEEYHLLGYNALKSVESQPAFRRNISPPSSGLKNKRTRNQRESTCRYVPLKPRLTFNVLHGVISQKTVLFITTAVRTSNPAIRKMLIEIKN
jgi:hypothetical protein